MDPHTFLAAVGTIAALISGGALVFFGLQTRATDKRIEALESELAKQNGLSKIGP